MQYLLQKVIGSYNLVHNLVQQCVHNVYDLYTIRPLVASSGSVMEAGVVRRFRARVSCSITASMSYSTNRNTEVTVNETVKIGICPCSAK